MNTVTVQLGQTINLGHQYDNYATQVIFPSSIIDPILNSFGTSGTFAIWFRRSGDALGYPIGSPLVTFDSTDSEVTWNVVETDLANPGQAQVQLRYLIDEQCVMSQVFPAMVADSVDIGSDVPEPMEQWADAIVEAAEGVHGIPSGGTEGQVLTKASNTDYDVEWTTVEGGCNTVIIDIQNPDANPPLSEETATAYYNAIDSGKIPIIRISGHLYLPDNMEKLTDNPELGPLYVLYYTYTVVDADFNKVTVTQSSFGISLAGFSGFGAEHHVVLTGGIS